MKNKFLRILLFISILSPNIALGRLKEKAIIFDNSAGHYHSGVESRKVDSNNIIYDNSSSTISAVNVKAALDELDTDKINNSEKGIAGGLATLDGSSKLTSVQLPAIAITDVNVCADQSCQLTLTAEEGDVCVRSDENKSYIHNGGVVGDMTDWQLLLSTGLVTSVNGSTGDIINIETTTNKQTSITDSDSNYPSSGAVVDYVPTVAELTSNKQTSITDSDSNYPSSGAVVDYVATHTSIASAHHSSTSDGLAIAPSSVGVSGGNITITDGAVYTDDGATTNPAFDTRVTGDSSPRLRIRTDGAQYWGDGASTQDTQLYRPSANLLSLGLGDSFRVTEAAYYTFTNAVTKYITVHASSFETLNSSLGDSEQWGSPARVRPSATGSTRYAQTGICLPNGVTVTRIDSYGSTNSGVSNSVTTTLNRITLTSNSASSMASCAYSDGGSSANDTSISNAVIDNTTYSYMIELQLYATSVVSDANFFNIKITYTATDLSQTQ